MPVPTINQGKYSWEQPDLYEGDIPVTGYLTEKVSGLNAMTAIIPFGRGVYRDAASTGMGEKNLLRLPSAAGQVIRGVALSTAAIARVPGVTVDNNGDLGYPAKGSDYFRLMSIITRGVIAVRAIESVAVGDPVTCVITAGANQGVFGKTTSASQIVCPTTWEWIKGASAGGTGWIHLK